MWKSGYCGGPNVDKWGVDHKKCFATGCECDCHWRNRHQCISLLLCLMQDLAMILIIIYIFQHYI